MEESKKKYGEIAKHTENKIGDQDQYYVGLLKKNVVGIVDTVDGFFIICEHDVKLFDDGNVIKSEKFIVYEGKHKDRIICLDDEKFVFNNSYELFTYPSYNRDNYLAGEYYIVIEKSNGYEIRNDINSLY